jgi:hypothetical protein
MSAGLKGKVKKHAGIPAPNSFTVIGHLFVGYVKAIAGGAQISAGPATDALLGNLVGHVFSS